MCEPPTNWGVHDLYRALLVRMGRNFAGREKRVKRRRIWNGSRHVEWESVRLLRAKRKLNGQTWLLEARSTQGEAGFLSGLHVLARRTNACVLALAPASQPAAQFRSKLDGDKGE